MGFSEAWIKLVWECIATMSFSVIMEEEPTFKFNSGEVSGREILDHPPMLC